MKIGLWILLITLLGSPVLLACDGSDDEVEIVSTSESASDNNTKPLEFTIGNYTDLTGPSAAAQEPINDALHDLVGYFNKNDLIPGIELKIATYDSQLDPSKDIPGYNWLRERGADLIWTSVPSAPITLKPKVNNEQVMLFSASGDLTTLEPPGYIFAAATLPRHEALTLLKWIAENDWNYEIQGPAKIGAVAWNEPNSIAFFDAAQNYAEAHPDQFEWVGGHLPTIGVFTFGPEVEALKDCDYVFPPTVMPTFVNEYRNAGFTAKLIGTGVHGAFLGVTDDAGLWDEIDGMLFIMPSRWWNEEGELVNLRKQLLYENHPSSAEAIIRSGSGYNALESVYVMLDLIRQTVSDVGLENLNSQTLFNAAQSYSLTIDDIERYSFSDTKRYAANYYGIYEASDSEKNLLRADPNWQLHVTSP